MDAHYSRFTRSCVLATVQAEFNAVPSARRISKEPRHISPRELDELLGDFGQGEPGPCVLWTGTTDKDGYAVFKADGRQYRAHRWLWVLHHGPVKSGLEMAHDPSCPNRHCVIHVSPQTKAKNLADRRKPGTAAGELEASRRRRDEIRRAKVEREHIEFMYGKRSQREAA